MTPSLADLARDGPEQAAQQSGNGGTDYERYETSAETIWSKQFPTTAVVGTATHLTFQPDFEQNEEGNWVPDYHPESPEFGVVLEDPDVYTDEEDFEGTVIVAGESETGDDYRFYNEDDDQTEVDDSRVIFGSNSIFNGEVVDEISEDELLLKATGSSGRSVVSTLDVHGAGTAHSVGAFEGEDVELHDGGFPRHNGSLFEHFPDNDDDDYTPPRVSRDPELRPDVEGRKVVVMLHRYSELDPDSDSNAYWATIFAAVDDDRREELSEQYAEQIDDAEPEDFVTELDGEPMLKLQPTTEFDPTRGNIIENGYIEWNRLDPEEINEAREEAGLDPYDFN